MVIMPARKSLDVRPFEVKVSNNASCVTSPGFSITYDPVGAVNVWQVVSLDAVLALRAELYVVLG
jgi:hypothetical protein